MGEKGAETGALVWSTQCTDEAQKKNRRGILDVRSDLSGGPTLILFFHWSTRHAFVTRLPTAPVSTQARRIAGPIGPVLTLSSTDRFQTKIVDCFRTLAFTTVHWFYPGRSLQWSTIPANPRAYGVGAPFTRPMPFRFAVHAPFSPYDPPISKESKVLQVKNHDI